MRRGAAAVLAALLLTAPARAEEAAAPPLPAETVKGECSHPEEPVRSWLSIMGYRGTASYGCTSARLDWSREVAFYRGAEGTKNGVAFTGSAVGNTDFIVTAVTPFLRAEVPATGRCRLITSDEGLGARRVRCFAEEVGQPEFVHLVEMVITERAWPGTAAIPGRCSAPGIAPYVLAPMIVQQTGAQQEPVLVPQAVPACRSLTVVPGQSFAFATGADGDGVTFSGAIDEERPELFTVTTITLPGGAQHPAQAGACLPKREADGHVAVLCMAAYSQDGATKYVEVGFIPAASRFEWPREEWEEEPAP